MADTKITNLKHSAKQTFAKSADGAIKHISEVESGLACKCFCTLCGHELQARKGQIKTHHFAHHTGSDCAGAAETALHLAAKEILLREKRIRLPAIPVDCIRFDDQGGNYNARQTEERCKARFIKIDEVTLEQKIGRIIPDIVVLAGGKTLLIEIAVTHFVDADKQAKIAAANLATIEIDLSKIDRNIDWELLRQELIDSTSVKSWIHNPRLAEFQALVDEELRPQLETANKRIAYNRKREAQKTERLKQERINSPEHKRVLEWIATNLSEDNINALLADREKKARNDRYIASIKNLFAVKFEDIPEFLNTKVKGELAFPCDRRIWQAFLFLTFFHPNSFHTHYRGLKSISAERAQLMCVQQYGLAYSPNLYWFEREMLTEIQGDLLPDASTAVLEYLRILAKYDFTKEFGKQRFKIDHQLLATKINEFRNGQSPTEGVEETH